MGIESLYSDGIEASIQRQIANPGPEPGTSFSTRAFLAAGLKGIPAAGLEVGGSVMDLLKGAQVEALRHPKPAALADQPDDSARRSNDLQVFGAGGKELRAKAEEFAPDPGASHTADQILFGLTKVGTKVAAATAAANLPTAAALLAGEGTNTAYHELIAKGVDPDTALKAGMVAGAGQAAAVIPMAGPTIKSTIALMGIAGPGTFMAQEALSKKILSQAGYADEASRHDPLDPLGLTLSVVLPAVFGGAHIVGQARAAKAAPTLADVVLSNESGGKRYGTDGKLLTSPKGAQGEMQVMPKTATDPGFGVVPARDGSPEELARVGRDYLDAMQHRYGTPDLAMAAYNAGPGAVDKALNQYGADWLRHMPDETRTYVTKGMKKLGDQTIAHAATDPVAIDAARVRNTQDALHKSMPDALEAPAELDKARAAVAAGEAPSVKPFADVPRPSFDDEHIGTLAPEAQPVMHELYAQAAREKPAFDATLGSIASDAGATLKTAGLKGTDRAVAKIHSDYGGNAGKIKDLLRATIEVPDVASAQSAIAGIFEKFDVVQSGRRNLLDPAKESTDGYRDAKFNVRVNGHIAEIQVNVPAMMRAKKAKAEGGGGGHDIYKEREALLREIDAQGIDKVDPEKLAKVGELNAQMRALYDSAWAEATSSRNSASEIGAPLRRADSEGNGLGSGDSQAMQNEGGRPAAIDTGMPSTSKNSAAGENLAGSASEADSRFMSTSEPILSPPEGKREPGAVDPQRIANLVTEHPDLKVQLPGSDETLTVTEALERARAEHALDASESALVQAAIACALGFGA